MTKVRMDETDETRIMLVGYEKIKANLTEKSEGNKSLETNGHRWQDNIKM
jgi:hypothetical protein